MNEAEVIEVLKRLEWVGGGKRRIDVYKEYCPWCVQWKSDGHADDCKLLALLIEARKQKAWGGTGRERFWGSA